MMLRQQLLHGSTLDWEVWLRERTRRTGRLRLRHHLALQRFGILSTLRLLSVHYAASGHLFCSLRYPPIIVPIGVQRQALLTERLRAS